MDSNGSWVRFVIELPVGLLGFAPQPNLRHQVGYE